MDDELEHSPRSWLDDFTQRFSWCHPSARASLFLNNYVLPGVGGLIFFTTDSIYIFLKITRCKGNPNTMCYYYVFVFGVYVRMLFCFNWKKSIVIFIHFFGQNFKYDVSMCSLL